MKKGIESFVVQCVYKGIELYVSKHRFGFNGSLEMLPLTHEEFEKHLRTVLNNADGTYSGKGYFGNGSGTYKAEGNMIYTYVSGEEYAIYTVKSLSNNKAELTMRMEGSNKTLDLRVEKK